MQETDESLRAKAVENCLRFLAARYRGEAEMGAWDGLFSASARDGGAPDLFGAVDAVYALSTLGMLGDATRPESRLRWADHIRSYQSADGWFRAGDRQRHSPVHASAYALGALALLSDDGADPIGQLQPIDVDEALASGLVQPWAGLPLLDRLHFWRGSHRVGGFAAVVGQLGQAGHADKLPGVDDADEWLDRWARRAVESIDRQSGMWFLAPAPLQAAFAAAYRFRHRPDFGHIGGATHVYWILDKLEVPLPAPRACVQWIMRHAADETVCEGAPYCLDFDRAYLLARNAQHSEEEGEEKSVSTFLRDVRRDVLSYLSLHEPSTWPDSSHKLPGALACVAEIDRYDRSVAEGTPWRDVFEVVWWL